MHELSLAMELVERLDAAAARERARRITRVEVVIGALSGVECEAFVLAFPVAALGHAAQDAVLDVTRRAGRITCNVCGVTGVVDTPWFACASCGATDVRVVQGEEFTVSAMEVI